MNLQAGWVLASHDAERESGLWFIFYSDGEGTAAIDLTREHPDIFYSGFEAVLDFEDLKPPAEKIVLLGGPDRPDDALVILHETKGAGEESNRLDENFSFLSYNYVLLPGKPPALTTMQGQPSRIRLKQACNFLVVMGYRIFDSVKLNAALKEGGWICVPATPAVVFDTPRRERRAKILQQLN